MKFVNVSVIFYVLSILFFVHTAFRCWLDYKVAEEMREIFENYDKHLEAIFSELDGIHHDIKMQKFVKKASKEVQ